MWFECWTSIVVDGQALKGHWVNDLSSLVPLFGYLLGQKGSTDTLAALRMVDSFSA